jgi:hypothetical protein
VFIVMTGASHYKCHEFQVRHVAFFTKAALFREII